MKLTSNHYMLPLVALSSLVTSPAAAVASLPTASDITKRFDYGTSDIVNSFKASPKDSNDPEERKHEDEHETIPCAAIHPLTNGFYNLGDLSSMGKESIVAWNAKGHDYGNNFTLGICSSPLKPNIDVKLNAQSSKVKINSSEVGAFYTDANGDKFSIGNFNSTPIFRGKKLTLQYNDGSFCPNGVDRKSTILSFTCDKEILQKAQISFVGALHDCDYFFEVRTVHACATAQKADNLAVIWIFFFILLAALFVYCSGGFLYKRIVLNRRGWRQLPNYSLGSKMSSAISGGVS